MCLEDAPVVEVLKADLVVGPCVYLIHLHQQLAHARHYVGSTVDLPERMRCYRGGLADASAFMRAVHRAGISWTLVRVWQFADARSARDWEYSFKKGASGRQNRHPADSCHVCAPARRSVYRLRMARRRAGAREVQHA